MQKKAFLIAFFQKLLPYRPVLEWFLPLLENQNTTDEEIEEMFSVIKTHVKTLSDEKKKEILWNIINKIQHLHKKEQIDHQKELQEAEELLSQL